MGYPNDRTIYVMPDYDCLNVAFKR